MIPDKVGKLSGEKNTSWKIVIFFFCVKESI